MNSDRLNDIKEISEKFPELEPEATDYFQLSFNILTYVGQWPPPNMQLLVKIFYWLYRSWIILTITLAYTIGELTSLVLVILKLDMDAFTDNMVHGVTHILLWQKVWILLFDYKKLHYYRTVLEQDVFKYERTQIFDQEHIIKKCNKQYRVATIGLILMCASVITSYALRFGFFVHPKTIIMADNSTKITRELPFHMWFPFDTNGPTIHVVMFVFQITGIMVHAGLLVSFDTIFVGLMIHTGGQLKILNQAVYTLRRRAIYELIKTGPKLSSEREKLFMDLLKRSLLLTPENIDERNIITPQEKVLLDSEPRLVDIMHSMLGKCVKHHEAIIKLIEDLEKIFSMVVLSQFGGSCLLLCLNLYQCAINPLLSFRFLCCACYYITMAWELGTYCWYGNEVTLQSANVSEFLYKSDWLGSHPSYKSSMLIMMARSTRRLEFTAGKFVPLTVQTFMSILRGSYSYYAFLNNFNSE